MHSADAETGAKVRRAAGSSQEGARGSCRAAEAQACCGGLLSCSSSRLWYRPAASGPFPPQLSHPHRTGAVEPATAAAPAAPDGAMETGGSHATVRLPAPPAGKPRARAAALSLLMCAPMRTARTHNLHPTALVAQAASASSAAPIEPSTSAAQQPASPVRPLSACHCTHRSHAPAPARSQRRPGRCLQRGDVEVAANASDADGSAEEDAGSMHAPLRPPFGRNSAGTGVMPD